jgi:phage tail protein X
MSTRTNRYVTGPDGSVVYVTIDGDMVDQIARFYYGEHAGHTEAVYAANPGLADKPIKLPAGLVIKLPAASKKTTPTSFKKLWD